MSNDIDVVWIISSHVLQPFDWPLLQYISQYMKVDQWEYHHYKDEGSCINEAVNLLDEFLSQSSHSVHLVGHGAGGAILKIENSGDWKQPFMPAAKALGKTETAKRLVDNYNARLTEFKQKMGYRLKKTVVSVVRLIPQTINLLTKGAFSGVLIEDAGLIRPPLQNLDAIATQKKWGSPINYNISSQILAQIDGNVLFIPLFGFKDPTKANNAVHQFMAESLWSKLKVVKQGKFYVINGFYWQGNSYISANRVLDDLFTYILHPLEESRSKRIKRAKA
ncbi:hypothetical protein [uncultured Nostoc sp.]|uniref:hypothetical protein n=1 Tax=uncultured Nostoc sp. TaxID=340711 RepID=UPI0035CA15D1